MFCVMADFTPSSAASTNSDEVIEFSAVVLVMLADNGKNKEGMMSFMRMSEADRVAELKKGQNITIEGLLSDFNYIITFEDGRLVSSGETKTTQQKNTAGKKQQRKKARRK